MMKRNTIKTIGIIILILSLFFLDPIPGPTDFVALQAYSMYSGADVGLDNLSVIYADYFIWSMVVGIILFVKIKMGVKVFIVKERRENEKN